MIYSFIRGFIDGDGSFYSNHNRLAIEIVSGSKEFLESKSEYKDLLFDIATFEKYTGDNITDGTDCII